MHCFILSSTSFVINVFNISYPDTPDPVAHKTGLYEIKVFGQIFPIIDMFSYHKLGFEKGMNFDLWVLLVTVKLRLCS